jgi:hypothetical protein
MTVRRDELVRRVCAEKLVGAQPFTAQDESDPILADLAGTNPCERRDSISGKYWLDLGGRIAECVNGFCRLLERICQAPREDFSLPRLRECRAWLRNRRAWAAPWAGPGRLGKP